MIQLQFAFMVLFVLLCLFESAVNALYYLTRQDSALDDRISGFLNHGTLGSFIVIAQSPVSFLMPHRESALARHVNRRNWNVCQEELSDVISIGDIFSVPRDPVTFDNVRLIDDDQHTGFTAHYIEMKNKTSQCFHKEFIKAILSSNLVWFLEQDSPMHGVWHADVDMPRRHQEEQVQRVGGDLWHLGIIGNRRDFQSLPQYRYRFTGKGVRVHVLDTSANFDHEELEGRAELFHVDSAYLQDCKKNYDCNGHGTHVSSTVAGRRYGVAKNAHIYASKVLAAYGSGTVWTVINGIFKVANRTDAAGSVILMSIGGGKSRAMHFAIRAAYARNITVIVSAGNNYEDACEHSPSDSKYAITVGSHQRDGSKSEFSNFGDCVDIYAPGEGVNAAFIPQKNSYTTKYGTSMSAPIVAGVVAMMLEENPNLTPKEVKKILIRSSKETNVTDVPYGTMKALAIPQQLSPCSNADDKVCLVIRGSISPRQTSCAIQGQTSLGRWKCSLAISDHDWRQKKFFERYYPAFSLFRSSHAEFNLKSNASVELSLNEYTDAGSTYANTRQQFQLHVRKTNLTSEFKKVGQDFVLFAELPRHCADVYPGQMPCSGRGTCQKDGYCKCDTDFASFDCSMSQWRYLKMKNRRWWYRFLPNYTEYPLPLMPTLVSVSVWAITLCISFKRENSRHLNSRRRYSFQSTSDKV